MDHENPLAPLEQQWADRNLSHDALRREAITLLTEWWKGMREAGLPYNQNVSMFLLSFEAGVLVDVPEFMLPTVIWALKRRLNR